MDEHSTALIPADDLNRTVAVAQPDIDGKHPHVGVVGDTYTILLGGRDTAGRFCLVDMHVPPGGGPPPHRHDFEETFTVLQGELEVTFRGVKQTVRSGETINIPANAPHQFRNSSAEAARLLCTCSPAGQEEFFSLKSAYPSPLARRLRPGSTKPHRKNSERKPGNWLPNTGRNFSDRHRRHRRAAARRHYKQPQRVSVRAMIVKLPSWFTSRQSLARCRP